MATAAHSNSRSLFTYVLIAVVAAIAGAWWYYSGQSHDSSATEETRTVAKADETSNESKDQSSLIEFPIDRWETADIVVEPAGMKALHKELEVTGKIAIDEDRLAHIFPLAEGVVDEVSVHLGDQVNKGDVLTIVQSREVGQAKLQLYQNRLKRDQIEAQNKWTQQIVSNVQELIGMLRDDSDVAEIEKYFRGKPIGEYRNQLLSAYIGQHTSQRTVSRLSPLSESGAVSGKQLIEAESQWDAARATLQSLIEQIQQESLQEGLRSSHALKEIDTRVAVDEAALKVLGFDDEELKDINPKVQGEAVSHMPISAPFDGTIISKDVVLAERVGPETQIFSIADLSSVWVTADIYEDQLQQLENLRGKTIHLRSDAWPNRQFDAKVFYTGDLVDPESRTITLRAFADNKDGLLKPGMFVRVLFPQSSNTDVVQVPVEALQDYEGRSFVFIHLGDGRFEVRDVTTGGKTDESVEITEGIKTGEEVVVQGGFALKSKMLASLLEE